MEEWINEAIKRQEKRIVSVLVSTKEACPKVGRVATTFDNIRPLDPKKPKVEIGEEFVADFRSMFPTGAKGNKNDVKERLERFIENHPDVTREDIMRATELAIQEKGKYVGYASYFVYKRIKQGIWTSMLEQYIEALKEIDEDDPFREND